MKRLSLAIALISSVALLSGCIIVPHRHGGYRGGGGYGHYQDGGRYQSGPVYVQPVPRR
ncbi:MULTISPECIES: hypothetical protein [Roseateles]|uniref:Lipoprotein n=1 Tax=Pelomonas aquatica TaxID=431058 RepID=A0ABU1ZEV6_9BURK|nr:MULTISPECIES: hypothetical protein [Roseateles]MDR7299164.1 hypothetical protein [Pelomonas aquatica]